MLYAIVVLCGIGKKKKQAPMALLQVSVLNTAAEKSFAPSAFQVVVAEVTPVCPLAGFA